MAGNLGENLREFHVVWPMKHDTGAKIGLNSARQLWLSMSNKRPLSVMRLLGSDAAQKSVIDIMLKQ